ncbi:hypothetical protein [Vibrio europaeus]|uniref:hypothetical protein n=1 Tax=Vibrio europaeus TaxID=300876 RepID=UPI00148C92FB|nr:hypothetical protein [Vibrio europaeus]NOH22834.1 hypothetical protein [Vibrio europaeus]
MKRTLWLILAMTTFLAIPAHAQGVVSGEIEFIRTQSADKPSSQKDLFWFTLKLDKAGECKTWEGNGVLFFANDPGAYSMVLAAFTAGKPIAVHFDESNHHSGWCKALHLTLGNPPPLTW